MANDMLNDGKDNPEGSNTGQGSSAEKDLGNLPPLSDFDSGAQFDSGLPPLSTFDSDKSEKRMDSLGGLPPISEISIETPLPTGGNIKPPPPGFDDFPLPAFDTPASTTGDERTGFQDLAADRDFSPETPELGPGPDSDVDTPMFDSAFGGAEGTAGFTPTFDTPAQTQAMETPIFGEDRGADVPGFDGGAFQGGAGFDAGTPMPDFSADSTLAKKGATGPEAKPKKPKRPALALSGSKQILIQVGIGIVALIIGVFAGPFLSTKMSFIPNPVNAQVAEKEMKISQLNDTVKRLSATNTETGGAPSVEKINELLSKQEALVKEIGNLTQQEEETQKKLADTKDQLDGVMADLDAKNEEFAKAQEAFEDLQNQTSIVQAQQQGLIAEVDRLTGMVGQLDEANHRRYATKEALKHSVDRLLAEVKEGIPLTPEEYSRVGRIAKAEELQAKVDNAKWVTPELLNDYTDLYTQELQIAGSSAYFFAKVPVTNNVGEMELKWSECLMRGNWMVYFLSIDGKNVGMYRNVAGLNQAPEYEFVENLPNPVKKEIADTVTASRVQGYEEKLKVLAQKQQITNGSTPPLQRVFQSL